jgi:hypothetical protein
MMSEPVDHRVSILDRAQLERLLCDRNAQIGDLEAERNEAETECDKLEARIAKAQAIQKVGRLTGSEIQDAADMGWNECVDAFLEALEPND